MSSGLAWYIAHVGFWVLLVYGYLWDEIGPRGAAVLLTCWAAGLCALQFTPLGGDLTTSYVAVLGVVLVFIIFKGDVRLT